MATIIPRLEEKDTWLTRILCRIGFHKWTKWKPGKVKYLYPVKGVSTTHDVQWRDCVRCHYIYKRSL
jgi:hypothetical protein